jgi:hypothetical protein
MSAEVLDDYSDLTAEEREAYENTKIVVNETSQIFVDGLIDKLILVTDQLSGHPLRPYQVPFARRIFESLINGEAALITACFSRQSGKSETVADVAACVMLMFPRLAKLYPEILGRFTEGVLVGCFAPVDEQADTLFGRVVERLTSDRAKAILDEFNESITKGGKYIQLDLCRSLCRKTTAHPRATIEGRTYHLIFIDESQYADPLVVDQKIMPMGTAKAATVVMTGTPSRTKGIFYNSIQDNKINHLKRGRHKQNHFEADWKTVGKYDSDYLKTAQVHMLRMGNDSDEFKLSYRLIWLLEQGMFTTAEKLESLGDHSMQALVNSYHTTPVVVGIDVGAKQDKTVVTVVLVDWDHPDQYGYYPHRILSWKDLEGITDWEVQYHMIVEYLRNYKIYKVGVDTNGLGDVFVNRMRHMMPDIEFVDLGSSPAEQSLRWKHLLELLSRNKISWPAGKKVQAKKVYRRFMLEMGNLEVEFKGPNMMGMAPKVRDAHDDYPDSLSMACVLTMGHEEEQELEVLQNFLYTRNHRY